MRLNPKSNYVKSLIKKRKFNRQNIMYINDLTLLEKFVVLGKISNSWGFYKFIRDDYPKEFRAIAKELNPNIDMNEIKKMDRGEKMQKSKEGQARYNKELKELKKEWIKLGGKI